MDQESHITRANLFARVVIFLFILLAAFTLYRMPPFENPDEADHFIYVHVLLEDGNLPEIDPDIENDPVLAWNNEAHQPPLYYAISALLISWSQRDDLEQYLTPNDLIFTRGPMAGNYNRWLHLPVEDGRPVVECASTQHCDTFLALLVLRGFGVLLAAITLWHVYAAGRLIMSPYAGLLAMVLCASLPAFVSVSASVTNDNLVNALYAVLLVRVLIIWKATNIRRSDILIISVLLALLALTKLTASAAFGLVYLVLIAGGFKKRFEWRSVAWLVGASLLLTVLVAGWWYVRNQQIYGDPLAMEQTLKIWERQSPMDNAELGRLWRTVWLQVGNFRYAPDWLLAYGSVLTVAGLGATLYQLRREPEKSGLLAILLFSVLIVLAQLLITSQRIDVSYGRLLFPALVGFALLVVYGLTKLIGTGKTAFLIVPLIIAAGWAAFVLMPSTYERMMVIDSPPDDVSALDASLETIQLLSYRLDTDTVSAGSDVTGEIVLQGTHVDRIAVVQSLLYLPTLTTVGQSEGYPGLADTRKLEPDQQYLMPLRVKVDSDTSIEGPLTLRLFFYDVVSGRAIPITLSDATETDALLLEGVTLN